MKKLIICISIMLVSVGITSAEVQSTTLNLLTGQDMAPYVCQDYDGSYTGINVEIIKEIFLRMKLDFEISTVPRKRISKLIRSGNFDGVLSSLELEDKVLPDLWYSDEMYTGYFSIISWKTTPYYTENIHKLKRGGILASTDRWDSAPYLPQFTPLTSESQLARLLKLKRIDGVLAEEIIFFNYAREHNISDEIKISERLIQRSVKFALSKKSAYTSILQGEFNKHLKDLISEEFIDKIFVRYLDLNQKSNCH